MTPLLSSALELAADGHPVLPLKPGRKTPLAGLGLTHATTDRGTVADWWERWPNANLGARCDGLLVIDVDGKPGEQSLDELQRVYGLLPATRGTRTFRGRHLFYDVAGVTLGQSTGPLGRPAGIDLRAGARGYVVAPPSMHGNGRRYEWLNDLPPALLPPRWLDLLMRPVRKDQTPPVDVGNETAYGRFNNETAYGRAALTAELERLLRANEGERNETLNAVVFRLAQLVASGPARRLALCSLPGCPYRSGLADTGHCRRRRLAGPGARQGATDSLLRAEERDGQRSA
jgi:hypothetical protein